MPSRSVYGGPFGGETGSLGLLPVPMPGMPGTMSSGAEASSPVMAAPTGASAAAGASHAAPQPKPKSGAVVSLPPWVRPINKEWTFSGAVPPRVIREAATLTTTLPVHGEGTGVFVARSMACPALMKVLIIGSPGTPYGLMPYEFDLGVPSDYPSRPPKMVGTTPGRCPHNQVRLNPNLYTCGYVCLSLLGTWSGPSWSQDSTLAQLLVSIQSLIFVSQPIENEPGWSADRSWRDALRSEHYDFTIRVASAYLMIHMLEHPQQCFRDVLIAHFTSAKESILANLRHHLLLPRPPLVLLSASRQFRMPPVPAIICSALAAPSKVEAFRILLQGAINMAGPSLAHCLYEWRGLLPFSSGGSQCSLGESATRGGHLLPASGRHRPRHPPPRHRPPPLPLLHHRVWSLRRPHVRL
eukprot:TRINITY_DN11388_c0_g1_i4.p1 TRINITY_DN11388_c0_g1~~TRINITY_DN11388_c0_g1_i4.p1  ORF type:complete len:411 (+),score=59.05 TRINITY_DN11388_c0_g1_i4:271-1503(+)